MEKDPPKSTIKKTMGGSWLHLMVSQSLKTSGELVVSVHNRPVYKGYKGKETVYKGKETYQKALYKKRCVAHGRI